MAVKHVNRKGQIFYPRDQDQDGQAQVLLLDEGRWRTVESIPEGFEIYENPDAQVCARSCPDSSQTRRLPS